MEHVSSANADARATLRCCSLVTEGVTSSLTLDKPGFADSRPRQRLSALHPGAACIIIALMYMLTFSWLASTLRQQHGFPLDDSYIHQTIGRNLAQHGRPGLEPDKRSSGMTSLLWAFVQAGNYKFLPPADPIDYNLVISFLLLGSTGPLLFLLTCRDGLQLRYCWIMALSPALMGNFLWLGMIGMEHLLFVVLSLAGIYLWLWPGEGRTGNVIACGCVAGLLALTRPEDASFGPFLVLLASIPGLVRRPMRDRLLLIAVWIPFVVVMVAANFWTSGSMLPATMKGRSWLYFHATGGMQTIHTMLRFLGSWIQRIPRQFAPGFTGQLKYLHGIFSPVALLALALLAFMLLGLVNLLRKNAPGTRALLLWAAAQFCIYLIAFPAAGHGGRYQPFNLLLMLPLLLFGVLSLLTMIRIPEGIGIMLVCVAMMTAGALSLHAWRLVTLAGIDHINRTEGQAALWVEHHLSPDTPLAAFDIGRVSYEFSGRVVDLGGLADPSYVHYLTEGRVPEFLRLHRLRYVMLPDTGMEALGFDQSIHKEKLVEYCSPEPEWLLGFRYTIHSARCQIIYRLPAE